MKGSAVQHNRQKAGFSSEKILFFLSGSKGRQTSLLLNEKWFYCLMQITIYPVTQHCLCAVFRTECFLARWTAFYTVWAGFHHNSALKPAGTVAHQDSMACGGALHFATMLCKRFYYYYFSAALLKLQLTSTEVSLHMNWRTVHD